jgi:hypothetical protein
MVLKRLGSKKNPETVRKVLKETVRRLDEESISGHVVKKSAEKSSNALVKSAKFTILKLPHALDYIFVTALGIFIFEFYKYYYPYFIEYYNQ